VTIRRVRGGSSDSGESGPAEPTPTAGPAGVILAAGAGTRLGALGTRSSKPMLPIAGQPLIGWVVTRLRAAGVERLIVVGHASDEELRDYLHDRQRDAQLMIQSERRGIADALRLAQSLIAEEPGYLACACDSLFDAADIAHLIARGRTLPTAAVVGVLDMGRAATTSRSAVLLDGERVQQIVEKPPPGSVMSGTVAVPVYWLPPAMTSYIERVRPLGGECYISTALNDFVAACGTVLAVRMRGRLEITTAADVARAAALLCGNDVEPGQ
jgi:NDP-sugar pyrophosphorylase family protein